MAYYSLQDVTSSSYADLEFSFLSLRYHALFRDSREYTHHQEYHPARSSSLLTPVFCVCCGYGVLRHHGSGDLDAFEDGWCLTKLIKIKRSFNEFRTDMNTYKQQHISLQKLNSVYSKSVLVV